MKNKIIAVIPARGGSKRIPYKNIRNFIYKRINKSSEKLILVFTALGFIH